MTFGPHLSAALRCRALQELREGPVPRGREGPSGMWEGKQPLDQSTHTGEVLGNSWAEPEGGI